MDKCLYKVTAKYCQICKTYPAESGPDIFIKQEVLCRLLLRSLEHPTYSRAIFSTERSFGTNDQGGAAVQQKADDPNTTAPKDSQSGGSSGAAAVRSVTG